MMYDSLAELRSALHKKILADYGTVEQFCWDNDLSKTTLSNFLNKRKDTRAGTILKIVEALGLQISFSLKLASKSK